MPVSAQKSLQKWKTANQPTNQQKEQKQQNKQNTSLPFIEKSIKNYLGFQKNTSYQKLSIE